LQRVRWTPLIAFATAIWITPLGCGDDQDAPAPSGSGEQTTATSGTQGVAEPEVGQLEEESAGGEPLPPADEAMVESTVQGYIEGLNARDGAAVCALLDPAGLRGVRLRGRDDGCVASLEALIGRRSLAGTPAWRSTRIVDLTVVAVGQDQARLTMTVVHRFADRKTISNEEDVVYLRKVDRHWVLAKPSGTLYRAVGYPEPPLEALAPPGTSG
jgi:hypothetical protein